MSLEIPVPSFRSDELVGIEQNISTLVVKCVFSNSIYWVLSLNKCFVFVSSDLVELYFLSFQILLLYDCSGIL